MPDIEPSIEADTMRQRRPFTIAACAAQMALGALALALPAGALAHGAAAHGAVDAKPAVVVKEQKPWGIAGDAAQAGRTIAVAMSDAMRFTPDTMDIETGETIRFAVHNGGKIRHEFVIGTKKELDAHAALMVRFPDMEHDEPYMAHVGPGQVGEIVWTFNRPGTFDFACLIAGHYQAGMKGTIRVGPAAGARDATVHKPSG